LEEAMTHAQVDKVKVMRTAVIDKEKTVNLQRLAFGVMLIYLWVMMILLGSIILETFMIYPNIFRNPPESLELSMEFMAVAAPNDFFPPLGFLSWVTGAASLLLGWRVKSARYWILASLVMIECDGLFSMAFFWPRNAIMFIEGTAVHSAEVLRQTAAEFQALHWSRLTFNALGAVAIFVGFLRFYRHRLISTVAPAPVQR
jgi:hypothetical protein